MTSEQQPGTLIDLDDTDLELADPTDDVRGLKVVDSEGDGVGEVDGLLIDEAERRVRFLAVGSGGFLGLGKKTRLIPVGAVRRIDDSVHVTTTRQVIAASPAYDPDLVDSLPSPPARYESVYDYYGLPPYWVGVGPASGGFRPPV